MMSAAAVAASEGCKRRIERLNQAMMKTREQTREEKNAQHTRPRRPPLLCCACVDFLDDDDDDDDDDVVVVVVVIVANRAMLVEERDAR